MRSQIAHTAGPRSLDSRLAQLPVCSCSYPSQPIRTIRRDRYARHVADWEQVVGRRPVCGALPLAPGGRAASRALTGVSRHGVRCSSLEPGSEISGYTPANYISFTDDPKYYAPHSFSVTVNAPADICFSVWNDWNRLVEFLDLVAQIGLDPNNPDMALFQCFYRHGLLPVMEIVFVLQKTEVVENKLIKFESVWGMPVSGAVSFEDAGNGRTEVNLDFSQALPDLLVNLKVGVFGVQNSLLPIFGDNLQTFKRIVEEQARDPGSVRPRQEAGERHYEVFDEEADFVEFVQIMENLDFGEDDAETGSLAMDTIVKDEQQQQQQEQQPRQAANSSAAAAARAAESEVQGPGVAGSSAPESERDTESKQAVRSGSALGTSSSSVGPDAAPAVSSSTGSRSGESLGTRSGVGAGGGKGLARPGRRSSGSDSAPSASQPTRGKAAMEGGAGVAAGKKRSARSRGTT